MVVVQNLGRNRPPSYTKWADSQLNDDDDDDDDGSRIIIWSVAVYLKRKSALCNTSYCPIVTQYRRD